MLELKPAWAHQMASQDMCVRSFPECDACARQVKPPGWYSFLVFCGQASGQCLCSSGALTVELEGTDMQVAGLSAAAA